MTGKATSNREIGFRLLHDGTQPGEPLEEPLRFGLQDTKDHVHPGSTKWGKPLNLDFTLYISGNEDVGAPVFRGTFAHGPPAKRFIYLSWKREGEHEHPWGWRIKIPLSGIGWTEVHAAERPGKRIVADVTGRRPHSSEPIRWQVE